MQLNGDVLTAYLSSYDGVEDYTLITSAHGTAYGDCAFTMILAREGFHAIPHIKKFRDTTMTVIVENRRPLCWKCKQLGHFSRSCPQKSTIVTTKTTATVTNTNNYYYNRNNKDKRNRLQPENWGPPEQRREVDPDERKKEEITSKTISN